MKKFFDSKVPFILVLLLFAIFNVIFWPIATIDITLITTSSWICYGFMNLAFFVVALIAFFLELKSKSTMTSLLPFFYTCTAYLFGSLGLNIILLALNFLLKDNLYIVSLIINLLCLLITAMAFVVIYKTFGRVSDNTKARETRMREQRLLFVDITSLIDLTEDEDIKKALCELKEIIDYSSTRSVPETQELEEQFKKELSAIEGLLTMDTDKQVIINSIKKAGQTWRKRNQLVNINRK